jgi:hypothetical protein
MICCAGLLGGFLLGSYLGGPWTVIAPVLGFAVGLVLDVKVLSKVFGARSSRIPKKAEKGE